MAIDRELEDRWELWRECLTGDDPNSIFQQIYQMTWDAAIFRMIIESRQILIEQNPDEPTINANLHSFIDRNFFQAQVARIRRFYDNKRLNAKWGVYSLRSLIKDMYKYRNKLTREVYFHLREIPYDFTAIQEREKRFLEQVKGEAFIVPCELNWECSEEAHKIFDRLSGTTHPDRTPQDVIENKVFDRLQKNLDSCKDVAKYVDNYVAHSATPQSRVSNKEKDTKITWKSIWDNHQSIYEVANFLSEFLYAEDQIPLAWERPSIFNYWDAPMVDSASMPQIKIAWENFREETETWRLNTGKSIWQWIEG